MKLKVLFVDDEPALCECFVDIFSNEEVEILVAETAEQALTQEKKYSPQLVFLDYRIPSMNGDELAKLMNPSVPKYLVTGELEPKPSFKFDGILPKPFDYVRMQQVIDQHIAK